QREEHPCSHPGCSIPRAASTGLIPSARVIPTESCHTSPCATDHPLPHSPVLLLQVLRTIPALATSTLLPNRSIPHPHGPSPPEQCQGTGAIRQAPPTQVPNHCDTDTNCPATLPWGECPTPANQGKHKQAGKKPRVRNE
ncbi:unnamed protein product, partial [Coccothraustes coccothraustes]